MDNIGRAYEKNDGEPHESITQEQAEVVSPVPQETLLQPEKAEVPKQYNGYHA